MEHRIRNSLAPVFLILILVLLLTGLAPDSSHIQDPMARAQAGDTVLVWINFVKPDKVEQYEEFVFDVFIPALKEIAQDDAGKLGQLKQTRLLRPTGMRPDSMLTYVWLMDPIVSGESYGFLPILRAVHSEEQANEYLNMFRETEAQSQVVYRTTQTSW